MPRLRKARRAFRRLLAPYRMMPDFIVIGAMRCGTTSLYRYITDHPRIAPAFKKEVHFYDLHYADGLDWYRTHFPLKVSQRLSARGYDPGFITGEASPYYLFHPGVPARVKQHSPDAKLLVILRNPVDRAFSHYQQQVRSGTEKLSFEEALEREEERLHGEVEKMLADERYNSYNHRHYSYVSRGVYADQLERWFQLFPREQFLIFNSEQLYREPAATMERVFRFLGVLPSSDGDYKQYNATGKSRMSPETRRRLVEYFAPHNERLFQLLGEDFGWDRAPARDELLVGSGRS